MPHTLRFEARCGSFSIREPIKDERRSYCSKKSGHLRYSAIVAAPGHDDLPHVELAPSERDPLVGTNTGVARKYPLPVGPSMSKKFAKPSALVIETASTPPLCQRARSAPASASGHARR